MIDMLLSLLGFGQAQTHKAQDRFAAASSHLSDVERICLETGVRLVFEIDRLRGILDTSGGFDETVLLPLFNMQEQNEHLKELIENNRDLLNEKGANAKVVAELERWNATCQVMPTQVDLAVQQIEQTIK